MRMAGKFAVLAGLWIVFVGGSLVVALPAAACTVYDKMTIADYNIATRMAVQKTLAAKGLYVGEIDGRIGPQTRRGLAKLTGEKIQSDFRLGNDLVNKIFGLEGYGLYYWEDEARLLEKLGEEPLSRYDVSDAVQARTC